jgi:hypothetical protein
MRLVRADTEILGGMLRSRPRVAGPRERRRRNEMKILNAVADHGTMTADLLSSQCWPRRDFASGLQMAQRTIKRLVAERKLLPRRSAHGGWTYILTRSGALLVGAAPGYDLSCAGGTYTHSFLTSLWIVNHAALKFACFPEHAFTHGRAPLTDRQLIEFCGHQPDCILIDAQHNVFFGQTEVAAKSSSAVRSICGTLANRLGRRIVLSLPYVFAGIYVVFSDEMEWHARHFARCARARWDQSSAAQRQHFASRLILSRVHSGPASWGWRGCCESSLAL